MAKTIVHLYDYILYCYYNCNILYDLLLTSQNKNETNTADSQL